MEKTFEFDVPNEMSFGTSETGEEAGEGNSWFDVPNSKVNHEKRNKIKKRKSLRSKILDKQHNKINSFPFAFKENVEPVSKRAKTTKSHTGLAKINEQKENLAPKPKLKPNPAKGFVFDQPKVKRGNTTQPQPFNFMKREEQRKKIKAEKEAGKGNESQQIDEAISTKIKVVLTNHDQPQPKRRGINKSRLNELAQPKKRPRMSHTTDVETKPFKLNLPRKKLDTVLAPPPPIKKSDRPTTKVNISIYYRL